MKVGIVSERVQGETRVAATPESVRDLIRLGVEVIIESKAGLSSGFSDDAYKDAGAKVVNDAEKILSGSNILLKVQAPTTSEISKIKKDTIVVGLLAANLDEKTVKKYAVAKFSAFAMEFIPRITRAQSMDVLSSQSNLAGYKAVIDAVAAFGKVVPMMMTAAGTIKPAKVLILGAGVAGLQAIATAKRLGAVVSAFDVRPDVKDQVKSLGATFIEVDTGRQEDGETKGGYAKEMSEDYKRKQGELIHKHAVENDIIISTALIPGKPAPLLITENMLKEMKDGSVVVDLATIAGGNCACSERNKVIEKHGITIIGYDNMPARVPVDASRLYAKNLVNFIEPMINKKLEKIKINFEDEIVQKTLITHDGNVVHPFFAKGDKQ